MNRIVKWFLMSIVSMFIFVSLITGSIILSDDNAYMLILLTNKVKRTVRNFAFNSFDNKDHSSATNGTGLNLLLIDQLDEGYCKEMLTLFRDSANKQLDSLPAHCSVVAFCGMQANETGFYSNTHLLKSYLPFENNKVIWKEAYEGISAENMSLYKVDTGIYNQGLPNNAIDGKGGETVFQFDPSMPTNVKSNLDGATNARRTKADNKFLPDILTAVNNHFTAATNVIQITDKVDEMDGDLIASIASAQHNRGQGGVIQYAFGIKYGITYSTKLNVTKNNNDEILAAMKYICELSTNYRDTVLKENSSTDPDNFIRTDRGRFAAVFMAAQADDWYLSPYAVSKYGTETGVSIWNDMFPGETVSNATQLKDKLNESCIPLVDAIKKTTGTTVTAEDVSKVYGTSASYDDPKNMPLWSNCGSIFHVSKTTSTVYKEKYSNGGTPYVVSCYDAIAAGHNVTTVIGGSYVYAYMLMLGGLTSVDPTNPDTYMGSLQEEDTYRVTGNTDWMKAYNVNESQLTEDRVNILTTAYNMTKVGATYEQNVSVMNSEFPKQYIPTKIDCSGFVSKVFNNSGFTNLAARHTTATIVTQDVFECISKNDVKPGDIFCSNGGYKNNKPTAHVVIYLSGKIGNSPANLWVIHSSTGSDHKGKYQNGPHIKIYTNGSYRSLTTSTTPTSGHTMYAFKIKGIDTGKYKTETWTKEGKKYYGK